MAEKKNTVQVVEKNPGTKIAWEQNGNKLTFGDEDLTIRCDTRQRDWPVHVDVCADEDHNLVIGVGVGRYYVAQVDIPPRTYIEVPDEPEEAAEAQEGDTSEESGTGNHTSSHMEPQPINMSDVVLTLWSLDDLTRN